MTAPMPDSIPAAVLGGHGEEARPRTAEPAQGDAEHRYRTLFDNSIDCIKLLDLDARLLFMNRSGQGLLEIADIKRYLHTSWIALWLAEDQARVRAAVDAARAGASGRFQAFCASEAGTPRWWDVIVTPYRDDQGRVERLLAVSRDITALKQAELALAAQEKVLTLVLDATPALISYVGADGRYRRVNRSYERWFGHAPGEVQGRHVRELLGEAAWQAVRAFVERALSGETVNYEVQIPHRDGGPRWVAVTYTPDRNPAGVVDGFVAHVVDIDGRKRAEAEIRSLNAALQTSVAQRTAQMQASNRDLEDFSYSVSHDLRAPLRAIDSFSKILLDDYRDRLDAEGQRLLGSVCRNVATMGRLIDDILAFSQAGRRPLALTAVDVAALAREVFDALRPPAAERGIELRVGALPPALADRAALRQVLVNLLSNAIKFTGPRPQALIEISGRADGLNAEYAIRDNGVGFDADYGHKLFGIFQRLHTADAFPGTGIGLAIVKRLVDKHGGRVWAESQPGHGATFHFALPLAAESPAKEPP